MSKESIQIDYELCAHHSELPEEEQHLLVAASEATEGSYAPYSHFHVGAAVLLDDGTIVKGSNQENVAYPSGLCAERVALFAASAQHPGKQIKALAITAQSAEVHLDHPVTPCGACRQVMAEYEEKQNASYDVLLAADGDEVIRLSSAASLLPLMFKADHLKKEQNQ